MSNQTQRDLWIVRESGKRGYKPTYDHLKFQWVAATTRCNSKGSYGNEHTIHTVAAQSIMERTYQPIPISPLALAISSLW